MAWNAAVYFFSIQDYFIHLLLLHLGIKRFIFVCFIYQGTKVLSIENRVGDHLQHSAFLSLYLRAQASHLCTLPLAAIPPHNLRKTVCMAQRADGISKSNTPASPQCPLILALSK